MLTDAPIEMWYLIGACIGDGAWTNSPSAVGTSIYPMSIVDGYSYDKNTGQGELTFTGYLTPDGFKLVHTLESTWPDQWGQGASFGEFVKTMVVLVILQYLWLVIILLRWTRRMMF